jgi:hypothetical protein
VETSAPVATAPRPAVAGEAAQRRFTRALIAFAIYLTLGFLYFGVRLLVEPGAQYVGPFEDPLVAMWDLAWTPHALLHGENPFVTHSLWAPSGVNLTWATSIPLLAVMFAPVTVAFGAQAGYATAMVVLPALSAWTMFLLCRRLTSSFWASLVGGYLFGFSSLAMGELLGGHIHMVALFLVPLAALVMWQYLEGDFGWKGLAVRLGPVIAGQLLISTEVAFTLLLAIFGGLVVGWLVAPARRQRLVSLLGAVLAAGCFAIVLALPFLYYLVKGRHASAFTPPQYFGGDLLNLVVPTHVEVLGYGPGNTISRHFPGNSTEQSLFLGIALAIVILYAWRRPWGAGRRFLYASLGVVLLAVLGDRLHVYGHSLLWLPWSLVIDHPVWDNVLPLRLSLYLWLAVAVIVALWTRRQTRPWLRYGLPALAVLTLVPNVAEHDVFTSYTVPKFFTDSAYRVCLHKGEIVLPIPIGINGQSDLWQTSANFRFKMAGGRVQITPPSVFMHPDSLELISQDEPVSPNQTQLFRQFIRAKRVEAVLVDPVRGKALVPSLNRITKPQRVGGILLYRVSPSSPRCSVSA